MENRDKRKRERIAYKEYKMNCILISRDTKLKYIITMRNHKERKVYLTPAQQIDVLGTKLFTQEWHGIGNWRSLKELRRNYILLTGAAKVLYANN